MIAPRVHRIKAFCDWLDTIPATPPFHTRPEFRFYEDLSDAEIDAAMGEMRRRSAAALSMAAALDVERTKTKSATIATVDLTKEQDLMLSILLGDAHSVSFDAAGAAELLMSAALMALLREYTPPASIAALERMIEGARQAVDEKGISSWQ